MRRREFIRLFGSLAAAWPLAARAQQSGRVQRIGFLFAGTLSLRPQAQGFWRELRELGYIDGQNVVIDVREARGNIEQLPKLASELVSTHPDVLVAVTTPGVAAAKNATQSIPIVMAIVANPLENGFVKNLARPEGNITGPSYTLSPDIVSKRMQLLSEMLPASSTIGILWNAKNRTAAPLVSIAEEAGRSLGTPTLSLPIDGPTDLKAGLERALAAHVNAILVMADPMTFDHRREIIDFSLGNKVPTFHVYPEEAADGAVAAYGASLTDEYGRAASYVAKILKGATPADLPVDQANYSRFVVNLKTAKALGLTVVPSLLATADEVIE
ncbi:MAG: ABC transporter substrate-binding protein [Xanthobacteraceae bacterium]